MPDVLPFPTPPAPEVPELADAAARRKALDIRQSFVVEAPAGSGKTGLLVQRVLKLLADPEVTSPEQVLAITFTKKATAEMRDRLLAHLGAAHNGSPEGGSGFDRDTRAFALAVLERDRQLGWSLLEQPARLRIRTIDSLCAEIARMLPVLSGSGGRLAPVEQAGPLYREAARRTLLLLGGPDTTLHAALQEVLLHRDGNLANCEELIADMLGLREQWGELIWGMLPAEHSGRLDDEYLDANVLPRLEAAMDEAICGALAEAHQAFPPDILEELCEAAAELTSVAEPAALDPRLAGCAGRAAPPRPCSEDLDQWQGFIHILIPPSGKEWRKGLKTNTYTGELEPRTKAKLQSILARLNGRDDLLDLLCELRCVPPARYPEHQWRVAKALFRVLNRAMVELQLVFAEREQCDFTELSLLAGHALSQNSGANDLAEAAGSQLQHLLVDEMQDTSSSQYQLLELLTRSWDGHSQTVFLVGDPRQSIYLFRQARVERFLRAVRDRRIGEVPLEHLTLTSNFRSQRRLVEDFNQMFSSIFPRYFDPLAYLDAEPVLPPSPFAAGVEWHATPMPNANKTTSPSLAELKQQQRSRDAQQVVAIVRRWFARPLPAGRRTIRTGLGGPVAEPWRIAVLVRSRNHLTEIAASLRDADIPMRAVNITPLSERQEILDLTALTRALLHPADRVASLGVLRAPWCGLTLADLHLLTGADNSALKDLSISRLLAERGALLCADARERAGRVSSVLTAAATQRGRLTIAQMVEKAWRSLGGDLLLDPSEFANAERFLQLIAQLESEAGGAFNVPALEARLRDLFAEGDVIAPETAHVELLTIHKAKGLEWDVVIVPGLERPPDRGRYRLLTWTTLDSGGEDGSASVLLAPIAARGNDQEMLARWLSGLHRKREFAEHKRLFYVACTRAREELHLFAAPMEATNGEIRPKPGTLLSAAWPAARRHFQQPVLPALKRALQPEDETIELAASAAIEARPSVRLRRLPLSVDPSARFAQARTSRIQWSDAANDLPASGLFARPQGSFSARAFGNTIHACLDLLSRRMSGGATPDELKPELQGWPGRIAAMLRAEGLPRSVVERLTREAAAVLDRVLSDRDGVWILSPHPGAASEFSLTAVSASGTGTSTVRADRIFLAGSAPHAPGDEVLWILDYKSAAHGTGGLEDFLERQKQAYAPQLEAYARALAPAMGVKQVRAGLYFPVFSRLLWWDPLGGG